MRRWVARNLQITPTIATTSTLSIRASHIGSEAVARHLPVQHGPDSSDLPSEAQQVTGSINEAQPRYALLLTPGVTPHALPSSVSESHQETRALGLPLDPPQTVCATAASDSQQPHELQHQAVESIFRQFARTQGSLSELTNELVQLFHQTEARMTPRFIELMLKELAVVFCRLKDEEMVLLARTWLQTLALAPTHCLGPHELHVSEPMDPLTAADASLALVAAESLLKMVEHVNARANTARHDFRALDRAELLLRPRLDEVIRIVDEGPLVDACREGVGMERRSRRVKVLIRHDLLQGDPTRDAVLGHWREMAMLWEEVRRTRGRCHTSAVLGRCRSTYMRVVRGMLHPSGEDVARPVLPLELLADSHILVHIPNETATAGERRTQTQRFGALWRRVLIRMIERGAEWDGPDGFSSVLEVYVGALRRAEVLNSIRHPRRTRRKALAQDLSEKIFLPFVARGIQEACARRAAALHGSRRRKTLRRVVAVFEMLGVRDVETRAEAERDGTRSAVINDK